MQERIDVLDHGYIRYLGHMGDDVDVANAARVSFKKEHQEFEESDARLLEYLARNDHTSPFRHAVGAVEVYAPLMVARQWWKYVVGSDHTMDGWNESSRRYVTEDPVFYTPEHFRATPENKKQGSGEEVDDSTNRMFRWALGFSHEQAVKDYTDAINAGIAPEQARLFLPAYGMYIRWRWTFSLQSLAHLIAQRTDHHAQWEFRQYARALAVMWGQVWPHSLLALVEKEQG